MGTACLSDHRLFPPPPWGLIADDLTGACDAGVEFAMRGIRTVFWAARDERPECRFSLLALNMGSREAVAVRARSLAEDACAELKKNNLFLLMHKIDSLLRGNWAEESLAVAHTLKRSMVLASPALPALGRFFREGRVAEAVPETSDPALVASPHAFGPEFVRMQSGELSGISLDPGASAMVMALIDASTEQELCTIASYWLANPRHSLLAGSSGLARVLAQLLPHTHRLRTSRCGKAPAFSGRIIYWIGSPHPVVQRQVDFLEHTGGARVSDVRGCSSAVLGGTEDLVVRLRGESWECAPIRRIADALRRGGPVAFVLSGGETAALVLRSLGIKGIRLLASAGPGIPYGTALGGPFDGVSVVTKSGSFGTTQALAEVARYLRP